MPFASAAASAPLLAPWPPMGPAGPISSALPWSTRHTYRRIYGAPGLVPSPESSIVDVAKWLRSLVTEPLHFAPEPFTTRPPLRPERPSTARLHRANMLRDRRDEGADSLAGYTQEALPLPAAAQPLPHPAHARVAPCAGPLSGLGLRPSAARRLPAAACAAAALARRSVVTLPVKGGED